MERTLLRIAGGGLVLLLGILLTAIPQEPPPVAALEPVCSQSQDQSVQLPCEIPGTDLIARSLSDYDGNFLEDGGERLVCGVAALIIENTGEALNWAQVRLQTHGGYLTFTATMLPAGSSVMVLEESGGKYPNGPLTGCSGQVIPATERWEESQQLCLTQIDMGTLQVTNLTDGFLQNVRIYFKTYHDDPGIYLGGVTYCVRIETLEPGQSLKTTPAHYAQGYSRIVRVHTE